MVNGNCTTWVVLEWAPPDLSEGIHTQKHEFLYLYQMSRATRGNDRPSLAAKFRAPSNPLKQEANAKQMGPTPEFIAAHKEKWLKDRINDSDDFAKLAYTSEAIREQYQRIDESIRDDWIKGFDAYLTGKPRPGTKLPPWKSRWGSKSGRNAAGNGDVDFSHVTNPEVRAYLMERVKERHEFEKDLMLMHELGPVNAQGKESLESHYLFYKYVLTHTAITNSNFLEDYKIWKGMRVSNQGISLYPFLEAPESVPNQQYLERQRDAEGDGAYEATHVQDPREGMFPSLQYSRRNLHTTSDQWKRRGTTTELDTLPTDTGHPYGARGPIRALDPLDQPMNPRNQRIDLTGDMPLHKRGNSTKFRLKTGPDFPKSGNLFGMGQGTAGGTGAQPNSNAQTTQQQEMILRGQAALGQQLMDLAQKMANQGGAAPPFDPAKFQAQLDAQRQEAEQKAKEAEAKNKAEMERIRQESAAEIARLRQEADAALKLQQEQMRQAAIKAERDAQNAGQSAEEMIRRAQAEYREWSIKQEQAQAALDDLKASGADVNDIEKQKRRLHDIEVGNLLRKQNLLNLRRKDAIKRAIEARKKMRNERLHDATKDAMDFLMKATKKTKAERHKNRKTMAMVSLDAPSFIDPEEAVDKMEEVVQTVEGAQYDDPEKTAAEIEEMVGLAKLEWYTDNVAKQLGLSSSYQRDLRDAMRSVGLPNKGQTEAANRIMQEFTEEYKTAKGTTAGPDQASALRRLGDSLLSRFDDLRRKMAFTDMKGDGLSQYEMGLNLSQFRNNLSAITQDAGEVTDADIQAIYNLRDQTLPKLVPDRPNTDALRAEYEESIPRRIAAAAKALEEANGDRRVLEGAKDLLTAVQTDADELVTFYMTMANRDAALYGDELASALLTAGFAKRFLDNVTGALDALPDASGPELEEVPDTTDGSVSGSDLEDEEEEPEPTRGKRPRSTELNEPDKTARPDYFSLPVREQLTNDADLQDMGMVLRDMTQVGAQMISELGLNPPPPAKPTVGSTVMQLLDRTKIAEMRKIEVGLGEVRDILDHMGPDTHPKQLVAKFAEVVSLAQLLAVNVDQLTTDPKTDMQSKEIRFRTIRLRAILEALRTVSVQVYARTRQDMQNGIMELDNVLGTSTIPDTPKPKFKDKGKGKAKKK